MAASKANSPAPLNPQASGTDLTSSLPYQCAAFIVRDSSFLERMVAAGASAVAGSWRCGGRGCSTGPAGGADNAA